uniref:Uncharacterized protein LOC101210554 isoform X2 n=1 Tax=Rhizophora mucronata TaxID=61149 RepID=A0A2P2JXZ9_RHIMU
MESIGAKIRNNNIKKYEKKRNGWRHRFWNFSYLVTIKHSDSARFITSLTNLRQSQLMS